MSSPSILETGQRIPSPSPAPDRRRRSRPPRRPTRRDTDAPDSGIVSPSAQGRALAEADVDATTRAPKIRIRGGTDATPR